MAKPPVAAVPNIGAIAAPAIGPKNVAAPMARTVGSSFLNNPASGRPVSGLTLSGSLNTREERPLSAPISESVI